MADALPGRSLLRKTAPKEGTHLPPAEGSGTAAHHIGAFWFTDTGIKGVVYYPDAPGDAEVRDLGYPIKKVITNKGEYSLDEGQILRAYGVYEREHSANWTSVTATSGAAEVNTGGDTEAAEPSQDAARNTAPHLQSPILLMGADYTARLIGQYGDATVQTPQLVAVHLGDKRDVTLGAFYASQAHAGNASVSTQPTGDIEYPYLAKWWPILDTGTGRLKIAGQLFISADEKTPQLVEIDDDITGFLAEGGKDYRLDGEKLDYIWCRMEQPQSTRSTTTETAATTDALAFSACWPVIVDGNTWVEGANKKTGIISKFGPVEKVSDTGVTVGISPRTHTIFSDKIYDTKDEAIAAGAAPTDVKDLEGCQLHTYEDTDGSVHQVIVGGDGPIRFVHNPTTSETATSTDSAAAAVDTAVAGLAEKIASHVVSTEEIGVTGTLHLLTRHDGTQTLTTPQIQIDMSDVATPFDAIVQDAVMAHTEGEKGFASSGEPTYVLAASLSKSKKFIDEASGVSLHLKDQTGPEIHLPGGAVVTFGKGCPPAMINRVFRECCTECENYARAETETAETQTALAAE